MKKILCLFIVAIFISIFTQYIQPGPATLASLTFDAAALVNTTINTKPALALVFSDEFNTPYLNLTKWMTQLQWGRTNWPELQYYAPGAFRLNGGALHILAQKQAIGGKAYSSGVVITYKSFKFTYGVVTIRARTPVGQGLWPALWLLDHAGGAQEIDILEAVGHQPNTVYMTLHYPTSNGNKSLGSHYTGPNFSAAMHVFTVDWSPGWVIWYVDGVERYRLTQHIPNKPMYLIMNLAVGGDWPGPPNQYTKFPTYFNIDYVRIYKRY